jgi:RHS repeat-associated protein
MWDGIQLFGEYDAQGNPVRTYLLSPESTVPLGYLERQSGGGIARRFFLPDDRGTPTHVINSDGSVSGTYVFDAWGREIFIQESAPQPLRYFAKWVDSTTHLLTWPLRHYDPDTANFLQKDPRSGAYAPYVFLGNDPASQQDDLGASWWDTLVETIKELPGALYEDFSSGAAAHRLQTFAVGVGQGAKGAVEGTVHAVCHPVETATGIAHVATHPSEVLHALGQQWDDLLRKAANDPEAFAEAVGRLCGEQMIAAITQAGTARALEAVKDLELVSKARNMFSRRARCTRIPETLQSIERPPCAMREVVQLGKRPSRFRVGVKRAFGAYNGKEWNICHTVSSEMLKKSIQEIVNVAEDQWELLGRRGYHPSRFGGSVQRAARKWYLDAYNDIENLSLGLAKENQLNGSLIPKATGAMKFVLRVDEPEIAFMGWVNP